MVSIQNNMLTYCFVATFFVFSPVSLNHKFHITLVSDDQSIFSPVIALIFKNHTCSFLLV